MLAELAILAILVALSSFFSASEAAILTINRSRLRYIMQHDKWSGRSKCLSRLKTNSMRTIMTVLLANNVVNISASFIASHATTQYFGDVYLGFAFGLLTFVLIVVGEIIPKNYGTNHADSFALVAAQPIELLSTLLSPIVLLLEKINMMVPGVYPIPGQKIGLSEEEIRSIFEIGVEDRAITQDERQILERVLDFNDTFIKEIMTPKAHVKFIKATENRDELLRQITSQKKSHFPVIDESNKVVGMLSLRKFVSAKPTAALREIMDEPFFVSREMLASDLFRKMRSVHPHMAIVLDPDGRMEGIVTMADLLEEIVGGFDANKVNSDAATFAQQAPNAAPSIFVAGDARLHYIEKELKITLPESERFGSVSAYLHHQLKRLPVRGDVILLSKCRFEVKEMGADYKIGKVEVTRL